MFDTLAERGPVLRLFVSSQMRGGRLAAERQAVIDTIDKTSVAVSWAWEKDPAAGPYNAEGTCLQYAATSDGLFLILADELTDITKKEYLAARDAGVPCFILVKDGIEQSASAKAFLRREGRSSTYRRFRDLADLREQVAWAIYYYSIRAWRRVGIRRRASVPGLPQQISALIEACDRAYLAGRHGTSVRFAAKLVAECDALNLSWLAARALLLLASRHLELGHTGSAGVAYVRAERLAEQLGDSGVRAAALMGRARVASRAVEREWLRSEAAIAWVSRWASRGFGRSGPERPFRLGAPGAMLILIAGPSGVGLETVLSHVQVMRRRPLRRPVPWTTRPRRSYEPPRDGSYGFLHMTRAEFESAMASGEMLEAVEVHGNWYGLARREVADPLQSGEDVLLKTDLRGASQLLPMASASIGIAPPSLDALLDRVAERDPTVRADDAQTALWFLANVGFDHVVVNETNGAEAAARDVIDYVSAARLGREDVCLVL